MHKTNIYSRFLGFKFIKTARFTVNFTNLKHFVMAILTQNVEKQKLLQKGLTNA